MRNTIIGIVIGIVIGVVFGTTVIAPKLVNNHSLPKSKQLSSTETAQNRKTSTNNIIAKTYNDRIQFQNKVQWKMASAFSSNLPQLGVLGKRLEKKLLHTSNKKLELKFFEPETLVPSKELFEAVSSGAIDAAFLTPSFLDDENVTLQLFSAIPFGPSAQEYLAWINFGGGKKFLKNIYKQKGVHGIRCGIISPTGSGWFRKPLSNIQDFKGLRIHFTGLGAKVLQELGVIIKNYKDENLFAALESGSIDGLQFLTSSIDAKIGFYKMIKHYYLPGWHQPTILVELIINYKNWNSLTKSSKSKIETSCGDNIHYSLIAGETQQFEALKLLQKKGVNIHRWSPKILKILRISWQKVLKKEKIKNPEFKQAWESLQDFRKNYTIWQELGYP